MSRFFSISRNLIRKKSNTIFSNFENLEFLRTKICHTAFNDYKMIFLNLHWKFFDKIFPLWNIMHTWEFTNQNIKKNETWNNTCLGIKPKFTNSENQTRIFDGCKCVLTFSNSRCLTVVVAWAFSRIVIFVTLAASVIKGNARVSLFVVSPTFKRPVANTLLDGLIALCWREKLW